MKIYTKTGDKGKTSLLGGKKIYKHDIRIEAYGTLDELNSCIGFLMTDISDEKVIQELKDIQLYLFVLGSHLAKDPEDNSFKLPALRPDETESLEKSIDQMTANIPPLRYFVLPGGSRQAAYAHVCRTICRRAERRVVELSLAELVDPSIVVYLNRLSDYLFTCARYLNVLNKVEDIPWRGREE